MMIDRHDSHWMPKNQSAASERRRASSCVGVAVLAALSAVVMPGLSVSTALAQAAGTPTGEVRTSDSPSPIAPGQSASAGLAPDATTGTADTVVASPPRAPSAAELAQIEITANQFLAAGQYRDALSPLRRLESGYANDPSKLGVIREQIRLAERNLAAAGPDVPASALAQADAAKPREVFVKPKPGETLDFQDIRELGNFDYDAVAGGNIPADVTGLSGSRIRVRGYMIPLDQAENITHFALVPSLLACCFGQPPQIQHTIVVSTPRGKAVSYYPDVLVVEGSLRVEEKKEDDFIISIFEMDASSVRPAPK